MSPQPLERDDARLRHELQALVQAQERLDRRREALDQRERELESGSHGGDASGTPDRAVTRLEAQVAALEKLLATRDSTVSRLRSELAEREALPAAVEAPAPAPEPEPVREPESQPEPVREPEPPPEAEPQATDPARELERYLDPSPPAQPAAPSGEVLEVARGSWSLPALERAIAAAADDPRTEEWQTYLVFLGDHADAAGVLPPAFDGLVWDVYGELITRTRGT